MISFSLFLQRVEEAMDLRRELAKLEKSEEERVQRLRWEYQEKEIRKLQKEQVIFPLIFVCC